MTLYVLDTDTLTLLEEGHPAVGRRFLQERPEDTAITVLTVEEQLSGWYTQVRKAKRPDKLAWAYRRLADTVSFLANRWIHSPTEGLLCRTGFAASLQAESQMYSTRFFISSGS